MALTAARNTVMTPTRLGETLRIPMAEGAVIYLGGLVNVNAYGYAVAASDASGHHYAGLAVEDPQRPGITAGGKYDNYSGDDGDLEVVVRLCRARVRLAYRTPDASMRFAKVYIADDEYVAVHADDVTYDIRCGHIVRVPADVDTEHPTVALASDEVEIEASGEPFDWDGGVTTTTPRGL